MKRLTLAFSLLFLALLASLPAQQPGTDGKIMLTVILRHDQLKKQAAEPAGPVPTPSSSTRATPAEGGSNHGNATSAPPRTASNDRNR